MHSHRFWSSGEAYNVSQSSDAVADGDILLVPSESRVAVLVGAWPVWVATDGDVGPGEFHTLADGVTWQTFEDGRYLRSVEVAVVLHANEIGRAAGLGVSERLLAIAREQGWSGEVPDEQRFAR